MIKLTDQEKLYSRMYYHKEVSITHPRTEETVQCSIAVKDINGDPDCQIGNFGRNFYFRTQEAIDREEYLDSQEMEQAVIETLEEQGFKDIHFITSEKESH